jgi:hypothetical protein
MKEEIKKKIEEEAVQFSKSNYADSLPDELIDKLSFIKGAEYGYSLAQQSVNSELIQKANVVKDTILEVIAFTGTDLLNRALLEIDEVIQSASQNQQNEKTAPSLVVEEAMKVTQKDVRVPNSIRTGEVTLKFLEEEMDSDGNINGYYFYQSSW